jgi:hypothetical protein
MFCVIIRCAPPDDGEHSETCRRGGITSRSIYIVISAFGWGLVINCCQCTETDSIKKRQFMLQNVGTVHTWPAGIRSDS